MRPPIIPIFFGLLASLLLLLLSLLFGLPIYIPEGSKIAPLLDNSFTSTSNKRLLEIAVWIGWRPMVSITLMLLSAVGVLHRIKHAPFWFGFFSGFTALFSIYLKIEIDGQSWLPNY